MKMLPVQLSLNPLNPGIWSDVLWRCPPAPSSQLAELKTQLPPSLPSDPRLWSREDVLVFLRFCVREFDLPKLDFDLFQMNGKALCLLTRADFGHRCPGAGDVLHNVLQMLIIESHMMQWHLPNSPVTPTSRYPLSPHSHPPTPTWPPLNAPPESSPFHSASTAAHMAAHHFMAPNSVTLSPPPSVDSQASSPPQGPTYQNGVGGGAAGATNSQGQGPSGLPTTLPAPSGSGNSSSSSNNNPNSSANTNGISAAAAAAAVLGAAAAAGAGAFGAVPMKGISSASSNHSDSEEEYSEPGAKCSALPPATLAYSGSASPPTTPILKDMKPNWTNSFVNSWSQQQQQQQQQMQQQQQQQQQQPQKLTLENTAGPVSSVGSGSISAPTTPSYMYKAKREFFPENSEPNTNGRLLWDFLQQLLNDRNQKYSELIAWKCRDTGVFKIVDPPGLAKLWGIQKNHLSMNYDKMSRALRYYYRVNILRKVQGERHCYQFLRNPTELKNIKNISLLRQSTPAGGGSNGAPNAASVASNNASTNGANGGVGVGGSPTNWTLPNSSSGSNVSQQQQQQLLQQHSPQRPASRNGNGQRPGGHPDHPMSLPAVAAVAAAAAAYGPPPTSPLFMHAFHYLSANAAAAAAAGAPPPNSPASVLNGDKFQFHPLKLESNGGGSNSSSNGHDSSNEDLKPTDLSVNGKSSSNEDCYPLIRNADGLTTIKLIRYNEHNQAGSAEHQQQPHSPKHPHLAGGGEAMLALDLQQQNGNGLPAAVDDSPKPMEESSAATGPAPVPMDSDCQGSEDSSSYRQMRQ